MLNAWFLNAKTELTKSRKEFGTFCKRQAGFIVLGLSLAAAVGIGFWAGIMAGVAVMVGGGLAAIGAFIRADQKLNQDAKGQLIKNVISGLLFGSSFLFTALFAFASYKLHEGQSGGAAYRAAAEAMSKQCWVPGKEIPFTAQMSKQEKPIQGTVEISAIENYQSTKITAKGVAKPDYAHRALGYVRFGSTNNLTHWAQRRELIQKVPANWRNGSWRRTMAQKCDAG